MRTSAPYSSVLLLLLRMASSISGALGFCFQGPPSRLFSTTSTSLLASSSQGQQQASDDNSNDLSELLTARLPTSVEDQVRQAAESVKRATRDKVHRQTVRLLLPLIGATELDDWPGGSRQQMEAAQPLMRDILRGAAVSGDTAIQIQTRLLDESDGVTALLAQATAAKEDSCTVLLPTAETVTNSLMNELEAQVGTQRNLILVNPQWRRRSDFGGFIGTDDRAANYVENFVPTFALTSLICEGESIRILRTYPGPWRVFLREAEGADGVVHWNQVGSKDVVETKPSDWQEQPANKRDGGILFNYGQPSYQEIIDMLQNAPDYKPKNPAERALVAFNFIKDTL